MVMRPGLRCAAGENMNEDTMEIKIRKLTLADYRNKGIGRKLLTRFLDAATQRGYRAISLSVDKRNRAKHLYERADFKVFKEIDVDYVMVIKI